MDQALLALHTEKGCTAADIIAACARVTMDATMKQVRLFGSSMVKWSCVTKSLVIGVALCSLTTQQSGGDCIVLMAEVSCFLQSG